jgi:hypothetical protein
MARRQPNLLQRVRLSPRARRTVLVSSLAAIAFGLAVLIAAWTRVCAGDSCPSIADLGGYDPNQASKVYAADGRLITDLGTERRTVVPLTEMSPYVKAAFITTEDKRFYSHHGIDWLRVFGAIKNNVLEGRVAEGFSTITMQLARNLWPEDISGRDKSIRRKMREARVALEIERKLPKDRILELYLNQIDLGNRAYGVEVASQRYFGKSVRDLNVAEAATLAAIPKAPSRYNPKKNPNLSVQRRNVVINLLRDAHKLSPAVLEEIRLLGNFDHADRKLLQILLLGQRELNAVLNREDLRQLKQRVAVRLALQPLSSADVGDYMRFRWAKAGSASPFPFSAETVDAVFRISNGIPRIINALCDNALLLAFAEAKHLVTVQHVRTAAADLDMADPSVRPVVSAPPPVEAPSPVAPPPVRQLHRQPSPVDKPSLVARWAGKLGFAPMVRGV